MSKQFEPLDPSDVISMAKYGVFKLAAIFKASDVINAIRTNCTSADSREAALLSAEGLPCEVLRLTGDGWQKGRVRMVAIEFCPDNGEELGFFQNSRGVFHI